ncbi:hypothetical protein Tco_1550146, partial [Tanacetum coccineum]
LGQMTHPIAIVALDSARSCVMQSAFLTQRKASSIPTVFSWGDSIRPEGFMSSVLLWLVIIVAVAMVVLVVVDVIIRVVVVSGVPSIIKLSFVIIGWAYAFHQDKVSSVRVPVANVTLFSSTHLLRENTNSFPVFATGVLVGPVFILGLLVLAIVAAWASRAAATLSATSFLMAA